MTTMEMIESGLEQWSIGLVISSFIVLIGLLGFVTFGRLTPDRVDIWRAALLSFMMSFYLLPVVHLKIVKNMELFAVVETPD